MGDVFIYSSKSSNNAATKLDIYFTHLVFWILHGLDKI